MVSGRPSLPVLRAVIGDVYPSNTALYADPRLVRGLDYRRRHRWHGTTTAIVAPHGGGIEVGTSELCLAISGYHPATRVVIGQTHGYWMFEGLRPANNDELHVTSSNCDDHIAVALCAEASHALGLHGCTASRAGLPEETRAVLVGGRDTTFRHHLLSQLRRAGFHAVDAAGHPDLGGYDRDNIANRTRLGMGAQLEITTALRTAMFGTNTRSDRKHTTTPVFWNFVHTTRAAIAVVEAHARPEALAYPAR